MSEGDAQRFFGESRSKGDSRTDLITMAERHCGRNTVHRHKGRGQVAKIAVVADEADQPGPCVALGRLRLMMLVTYVMIMGRDRMLVRDCDRVLVMLSQRVIAERHDSRERAIPGEPQQHPYNHYEAEFFHSVENTLLDKCNGWRFRLLNPNSLLIPRTGINHEA